MRGLAVIRRAAAALGLLSLAMFVSSCDTKNVGRSGVIVEGLRPVVSVPAHMNGGVDATWTIVWVSGVEPFAVEWNFGGGARDIAAAPATSPHSVTVTMINPSSTDARTYTYRITLIDGSGRSIPVTGSYVVGPGFHPQPSIDAVSYVDNVLTVTVSQANGDDVTVSPSRVIGLSFTPESVIVHGGSGDAVFVWTAEDFISGGSGTTTITAEDDFGAADTVVQAISVPAQQFEVDTIYVLPYVHQAATGDAVTFVCVTGVMTNPFQYLNGVGVTIEDDADYVTNSFNAGPVGGGAGEVDGPIWTAVSPSGFLLADQLIQAVPSGAGNSIPEGRVRWSFNLTGLGGSDINNGEGVLFNFRFTFGEPGLKRVGLQAVDGVNRTYYSDGASTEYFWGTLMADEFGNLNVSGVDNTVLVE